MLKRGDSRGGIRCEDGRDWGISSVVREDRNLSYLSHLYQKILCLFHQ